MAQRTISGRRCYILSVVNNPLNGASEVRSLFKCCHHWSQKWWLIIRRKQRQERLLLEKNCKKINCGKTQRSAEKRLKTLVIKIKLLRVYNYMYLFSFVVYCNCRFCWYKNVFIISNMRKLYGSLYVKEYERILARNGFISNAKFQGFCGKKSIS